MPEVTAGQTYLDILRAFTLAGATDRIRDHVLAYAILELADRKPPLAPSSEFMTALRSSASTRARLDKAISGYDPNRLEHFDYEELKLALAAMRKTRADIEHLVRRTLPTRGGKHPKKSRRGHARAR